VSFWTGNLEQGVNVGGAPSKCVVATMFQDVLYKKILPEIISFGHERRPFVLNRVAT